MSKYLSHIRVVDIPKFRAVSSGYLEHGEVFETFGPWIWDDSNSKKIKNLLFSSADFMWHENDKTIWIVAIEDWVTEADVAPFEIIEFEGGLYVVSTANEDDPGDRVQVGEEMVKWVEDGGIFEMDFRPGHVGMGVGIPSEGNRINKALGFGQQQIFYPIKLHNE